MHQLNFIISSHCGNKGTGYSCASLDQDEHVCVEGCYCPDGQVINHEGITSKIN